jgi:hypothetical protein
MPTKKKDNTNIHIYIYIHIHMSIYIYISCRFSLKAMDVPYLPGEALGDPLRWHGLVKTEEAVGLHRKWRSGDNWSWSRQGFCLVSNDLRWCLETKVVSFCAPCGLRQVDTMQCSRQWRRVPSASRRARSRPWRLAWSWDALRCIIFIVNTWQLQHIF